MSQAAAETDRRGTILAIAAELFAANGVASTSVREIGNRAGMLSGSLYYHFGSKDEMVQEIILSYLTELTQRYDAIRSAEHEPIRALDEIVRASLQVIANHPYATEIYQNDAAYLARLPRGREVEAATERVPETWLSVIEQGVVAGVFRDDIPPRIFYNLFRDALWRSVLWFDPQGERTREDLADDMLSVFFNGFAAPHGGTELEST